VELRATLAALDDKRFNCEECLKRYDGHQDAAGMTKRLRQSMACQETRKEPLHRLGKDLSFATCPGNFYSAQATHWISVHRKFEAGVMPYPGGLLDQPAKAIEIMNVISSHYAERMKAEQDKLQALERSRKAVGRGR